MEKPSHKIAISVTATLIATAILRFTTGFTFTGAFHWIRGVFDTCWNWLVAPTSIPVWVLCLLIVLSLGFILVVGFALYRDLRGPSSSDYTKDSFEGLVWRWSYSSSGGIRDPWCFCPRCDGVLAYQVRDTSCFGEVGFVWVTDFICDHCGTKVSELRGDRDTIVDRIRRLIDRKIRVGEWQEVVAQQTQKS